jgi:transposase
MINVTKESLIDFKAAAKQFGVTIQTIRNWANRQTLPRLETVKIGGMVRTSLEALQRFVIYSDETQHTTGAHQYKSETDLAHEDALRRLRERHGIEV